MNIEEAKRLVEADIQSEENGFAIVDDSTQEFEKCWVFIYQSKSYIETRRFEDTIVGHGPIIVDKASSEIFQLGSGHAFEECLEAFNNCGDPFARITPFIEVNGWSEGAKKVPATGHIKFVSGLGLSESKYVIDQALKNIPARFKVRDLDLAEHTIEVINGYGFSCRQLWSNQC